MAALQKGHFGKGLLQERNPEEREEQEENKQEERGKHIGDSQRATQAKNNYQSSKHSRRGEEKMTVKKKKNKYPEETRGTLEGDNESKGGSDHL